MGTEIVKRERDKLVQWFLLKQLNNLHPFNFKEDVQIPFFKSWGGRSNVKFALIEHHMAKPHAFSHEVSAFIYTSL